jgi:dTDP-4-dehydrorhamnose 3,5-epimerase
MSLDRPPSVLPGVRFGAVQRHSDERGSFRELWRAEVGGATGATGSSAGVDPTASFVQANWSTSVAGVLRGLHVHRRQLDYWVVAAGRAFVALVDVRPLLDGSAEPPVVETRELAVDDWVVIPAGVAHGFLALEPIELIYLVTTVYDGSDELGFAWDDPAVDVPWPIPSGTSSDRPIVSSRDAANPPLADLVARLRAEAR